MAMKGTLHMESYKSIMATRCSNISDASFVQLHGLHAVLQAVRSSTPLQDCLISDLNNMSAGCTTVHRRDQQL